VHLAHTLKENWSLEDYQSKWIVGFVKEPTAEDLADEEKARKVFNWTNLRAKEKNLSSDDLSVSLTDDN
jgi:hypothetical protein